MGETARKVDRGRDKIRGRWEREREGGRETEEGECSWIRTWGSS